jgi:multicomponent Na+:H+ antiporter subunit E
MKINIPVFLALFLVWTALAGLRIQELIVGFLVSLAITILLKRGEDHSKKKEVDERSSAASAIKFVFLYIPLFIFKVIHSNFQMARIILSPRMDMRPGFVRIKSGLESDAGKLTLANSITLTPGTVTLDFVDDNLLVHWIDVTGDDDIDHMESISGDFEKVLGGIFK